MTRKLRMYRPVIAALRKVPRRNRTMITIDGPMGVGKTTLARFLALELAIAHVECDNFLDRGQGWHYRESDLDRMITGLMKDRRPFIVEGFRVRQTLAPLGWDADIAIVVRRENVVPLPSDDLWSIYQAQYEIGLDTDIWVTLPLADEDSR